MNGPVADDGNLARRIAQLEAEIADLQARFPAHSLKPAMFQRLEELEEELDNLRSKARDYPFAYTVTTDKDFEAAVAAVQEATVAQGMKVQHVHDVQTTLASKGFTCPPLKIVEVCNAPSANKVLQQDIMISLMMPCKINVFVQEGTTYISALRPTVLTSFFPEADLEQVAREVDGVIVGIVEAAK